MDGSLNRLHQWVLGTLAEPGTTDLCLSSDSTRIQAFVERSSIHGLQPILPPQEIAPETLRIWAIEQILSSGRSWDAKHPFVDAVIAPGLRLHLVFPPISPQGLQISIRRLPRSSTQKTPTPWKRDPAFETLRTAVQEGESLLLSGQTGAGKTTLLNALLESVPHHERILALEDTPELSPAHPQFVSLLSRPPNADGCGEVTLRSLMKQSLRMRPDRIILGECRGPEVQDLLQCLNTGHRGAMATLHANSTREALRRIELLCMLHGEGRVPLTAIRELIAQGLQWVAQLKRDPETGTRYVSQISRLRGREGDTILLEAVLESEKPWKGLLQQSDALKQG